MPYIFRIRMRQGEGLTALYVMIDIVELTLTEAKRKAKRQFPEYTLYHSKRVGPYPNSPA